MELFFRKYFWMVNAAFIALATLLMASTVNLFVESALSPTEVPSSARASRPKPAEVLVPLSLPRLASLSGMPLPPEPDVHEPQTPAIDLNAAPVKTSLRVRLLGTLLAGLPGWSIASIEDVTAQKSQTYMVHDKIQGAEVLEIDRARVIILNNGHREYISSEAGDGALAVNIPVKPPTGAVQEPGTMVTGSSIRALDENNYEVPRPEIDKTLSNLNDVAMQARIVPAFKDGQAEGFKLFSIRPDSIYTRIGIQNGDVIRRINGFDLNSPEKALEVYSKLKEANRIEIEVERNGSVLRKTYNIQ